MANNIQQPAYGLVLSLLTAFLWGVLPVGLTLCLQVMDSATITFYRFLVAALVVTTGLALRKSLVRKNMLSKQGWLLAFIATALLVTNYTTNVLGLQYLSASSAQVLMQLAPISLMLGGVLLFKESFSKIQGLGLIVLLFGLFLFFNQRLPQIIQSERESVLGLVIISGSALAWACYALAQKPLLSLLSVRQVTWIFYVLGSMLLLPLTKLNSLFAMSYGQLAALAFCCLNTLFAYGAFTKAMKVWSASRVSAVLATQPIFTYISMRVAQSIAPDSFYQPNLDLLAYCGGALVVTGSMITALGRER